MPHIPVSPTTPGIRGLFDFRPETGAALKKLAHVLLHGESPLTKGERELIATFVSHGNGCKFCTMSHAAAARFHYGADSDVVDAVVYRNDRSGVSELMSVLLDIAERVRIGGRNVSDELVAKARALGAVDRHIHDTVLIAAAFCMFNRYVDGLRALTPEKFEDYVPMGERMATLGYSFEVPDATR
ncbi:MAG: carboxymuconolactone decarboxylase [Candidatus Kapabacteria bacterium]|nr:carboxymuconolactone decarboxylase [Candidatus Kapabacteria bacterium]